MLICSKMKKLVYKIVNVIPLKTNVGQLVSALISGFDNMGSLNFSMLSVHVWVS